MNIRWMTKDEFWRSRNLGSETRVDEDTEFRFEMPLDEIRMRIREVPPEFTPSDEGDFPGPVVRWYGTVDENRFLLTYSYHPNGSHCVVVQTSAEPAGVSAVSAALARWRS